MRTTLLVGVTLVLSACATGHAIPVNREAPPSNPVQTRNESMSERMSEMLRATAVTPHENFIGPIRGIPPSDPVP
jgi:hypothetical protein